MSDDTTTSPADFADVFDDWISGATLGQRSVEIYGKPGLFAEYEQLDRELKVAEAARDDVEASLEDDRVGGIQERMAALYEEWMTSKSVWTIRALPKPIAAALSKQHPETKAPGELAVDADESTKQAHAAQTALFEQQADARNYAILEQTVVRVEFGDGRVVEPVRAADGVWFETPAVNAARLATLRDKLGDMQFIKLIAAGKQALVGEPVIPAPFLRASSKTDRT